jgi:DNA polymerase elongation subunit (family B)
MKKIYFDLETEGQSPELLTKLVPEFEAPGNFKDPEKIKDAIAAKRAEWFDRTALKAITGKIIAFTYSVNDEAPKMVTGDEATLIRFAINTLADIVDDNTFVYGWNSNAFDMPFLMQRAAALGIPAFNLFLKPSNGRHYLHKGLIDVRAVWSLNSPEMTGTSLGAVALALGVGEKIGDGADFSKLLKSDPKAAEQYAVNDIILLRAVAKRMGL